MDSTKRILLASLVLLNAVLATLSPSKEACAAGGCPSRTLCGNPNCAAFEGHFYQICQAKRPPGCCYIQHKCVDLDPGCQQSGQNAKVVCYYVQDCP